MEHFICIKIRSIAMKISFWKLRAFDDKKNRVAEAPLVIVLNVNYVLLFRYKLWQWLPAASLERCVLYYFLGKLQNSGESKTGFVADEFCIKLSDPIC